MDIKLTNQNLITYARTEDAHEAFVNSVGNGQARLALEVLVDLINGMIEKIEELEEIVSPTPSEKIELVEETNVEVPQETVVEVVSVEEPVIEEPKPKSKTSKPEASPEKPTDAEV